MTQTVTVDVLGDLSLITGQTVVVRENKTGLPGNLLDRRRCPYLEARQLLLQADTQLPECRFRAALPEVN